MLNIKPSLNKTLILDTVSEEELFYYYTGQRVVYDTNIQSPLRHDKKPTCRIYPKFNGTGIWMVDFSGAFSGDAFDIIRQLHPGITSFYQLLCLIAYDLDIPHDREGYWGGDSFRNPHLPSDGKVIDRPSASKEKKGISVVRRHWVESDKDYWAPYHISLDTLEEYCVVPVRCVFIDNNIVYGYRIVDKCYGYYYGDNEWKLYYPLRDVNRFLGNSTKLQGYEQLPGRGPLLIVTKALKDVMSFRELRIPAVAPQAEGHDINHLDELKERFDQIVTWYDPDAAGRRATKKAKKLGLQSITIEDGSAKDPAELGMKYGLSAITEYLKPYI